MTTPIAQPPPSAQAPPPPPTSQAGTDAILIAAIATALVTAATAEAALVTLRRHFRGRRELRLALLESLRIVMAMPPEPTGVMGSATVNMSKLNTLRRAQFALSAARRLTQDVTEA